MQIEMFISPIKVVASKCKSFILNLNQYRNTHFRVLNNCKINYKADMEQQINKTKFHKKVICIYTVYNKRNIRFDLGNVCCIHQKFFEDALVELGKLEDDNVEFIPLVLYKYGNLDRENPRVEIQLIDITKDNYTKFMEIVSDAYRKEMLDGTK